MLKKSFIALSLPVLIYANSTMTELFDALKNHSQTKSDTLTIEKAGVYKELANSKLYPKINLFAKYDNYSTPNAMVPVPPNSLLPMVKTPSVGQPFSYNIYREGASISMPLFVKSIFSMARKAELMKKSAKAKKKINLLKNEAVIVGANANLAYLEALERSLISKEKSLLESKQTIKIKIQSGRFPQSALYKIDDGLNQINIAKNNIALQKEKVRSLIQTLTGIRLENALDAKVEGSINTNNTFASLEPLRKKIMADKIDIKAAKEKLYPAVFAHASYVYSQAEAYNNSKNVDEEFGDIGVVINIPILAMDHYSEIKKAKVDVAKSETELAKLQDELTSKAQMLQNSLKLLDDSEALYKKSVQNKEKLLAIAKVNYESGRLSTEEYLRYEDDVVAAKANLYKIKAEKTQNTMQLAVIYANNIEEMIK